jgi:hypothetical protein
MNMAKKRRGKTLPHGPQYARQVRYLHAIGAIPKVGVSQIDVYHDGWCKLLAQEGACDCKATVKIRWAVDEARRN